MNNQQGATRRRFLETAGLGITGSIAGCTSVISGSSQKMKLGLIVPLSGPLSLAAKEMRKGAKLAQSEINDEGGILGGDLELLIKDSQTSPSTGTQVARELVQQENVDAVVGTVSSGVRDAAFGVTEGEVPLAFPPTYEGGLCSKYFFGMGPIPNQTVAQALPGAMDEYGKRVFLIGSDFAYPRALHPKVKEYVKNNGGKVIGSEYAPLGTTQWGSVIDKIKQQDPDLIFDTTPGPDGVTLMNQLQSAGVLKDTPVFNSVLDEPEMAAMDQSVATSNIYTILDYFMGLDTEKNKSYKNRYREKFGKGVIFSIGVNTYTGVRMFAKAADQAGEKGAEALINAAENVKINSPKGTVSIDSNTHHSTLNTYIGAPDSNTYPTFKVEQQFKSVEPKVSDCNL